MIVSFRDAPARVQGETRDEVLAGVETHMCEHHDRALDAELELEVDATILLLPH